MTQEEIENFKTIFVKTTKKQFKEQGELRPYAMLMNENFEIFPVLMPDPESTKQVAMAIRALCKWHKCVVCCIALELWTYQVPESTTALSDFLKIGKKVSELPEKKEGVTMYMETLAGAEQFLYDIERPANNLVNERMADTVMDVFKNMLQR